MREIILDTETTGLDPFDGHKMTEIGAIELINHIPTGRTYQQYINPERDVPIESVNVTGLTEEFLKDFPSFSEIVGDFLEFIGDGTLVIHNAEFDMKFLNYQLKETGFKALTNNVIDTLTMARQKFPGSPATLDALCRRFEIDNSNRELHGALLDSELLAEVYIELLGGRQQGLELSADTNNPSDDTANVETITKKAREYRSFDIPESEQKAHDEMLDTIKDPIWNK